MRQKRKWLLHPVRQPSILHLSARIWGLGPKVAPALVRGRPFKPKQTHPVLCNLQYFLFGWFLDRNELPTFYNWETASKFQISDFSWKVRKLWEHQEAVIVWKAWAQSQFCHLIVSSYFTSLCVSVSLFIHWWDVFIHTFLRVLRWGLNAWNN